MDRLPPNNPEAERALLGLILRDNARIDDVAALKVEDFYTYAHSLLYAAMVKARQKGESIDAVLLAERLKDKIEDVGGYAYLVELWESAPAAARIEELAKVIRDTATRRALILVANDIHMLANEVEDVDELLQHVERQVFAIGQRDLGSEPQSNRVVVTDSLSVLDRRMAQYKDGKLSGLSWGLCDLDSATAGLHAGEVVIVAARPGIGKTVVACHLADVVSAAGTPVLFVSLEQSAVELSLRLLAKHSRVNAFKLRRGTLTDIERPVILDTVEVMGAAPIWWDDTASQTITRIGAQARRMKSKHNIGLLIVDYLQLVAFHDKRQNRNDGLGEISRGLKLLARDLNIAVVAMAQLNREADDAEPKLSHLRESGNIEQDSDTVIMLHPDGNLLNLLIRKQRNGPLLKITVVHEKEFFKLTNVAS